MKADAAKSVSPTMDEIQSIVRGVILGMSLNGAFRSVGISPEIGRRWLRDADDYEYHRRCYILRKCMDDALASEGRGIPMLAEDSVEWADDALWTRQIGDILDAGAVDEWAGDEFEPRCVCAPDEEITIEVLIELRHGARVEDAFKRIGVDECCWREWLEAGERYQSYQSRYVLREALDSAYERRWGDRRGMLSAFCPAGSLWGRMIIRGCDAFLGWISRSC